jgi:uncharacterized protein (TIGR03435 family)
MARSLCVSFPAVLLVASAALFAQQPSPAFEVASIKPAGQINPARIAAGAMRIGMTVDNARVDIGFFSIADLIRTAYRVKQYQVTGPDWLGGDRFNIQAKIPDGVSKDLVPEMLQALLAERFKLTFHRENKEMPVYAVVTGKNGPKLKQAEPEPATPPTPPKDALTIGQGPNQVHVSGSMQGGRGVVMTGGGRGGTMRMAPGQNGGMRMEASKIAMPAFAEMLSRFVDRPVVDMTELKGDYQVGIDISMEEIRNVAQRAGLSSLAGMIDPTTPIKAPADGSDPTSIFTSIQQLGLKLEPRKSPAEIIVVDHVEKAPTEN